MGVDKRIVLKTLKGIFAGQYAIQGRVSNLMAHFTAGEDLPAVIEGVDFGDHSGRCRLIMTRNRYVLYVEDVEVETDTNASVL